VRPKPSCQLGAEIGAEIEQSIGANHWPALDPARLGIRRDRDQPDLPRLPDGMPGGVNEDCAEPWLEGTAVSQFRQISPDEHERLLDDLVGIDPIATDRPNEPPGALESA